VISEGLLETYDRMLPFITALAPQVERDLGG